MGIKKGGSFAALCIKDVIPQISSGQFLGRTDVFGAVGFGTTVAAYNGRLVRETFDAVIVLLGL